MKDLSKYISEMFDVEYRDGDANSLFATVTLTRREVECSELDEDQFVEMMTADLNEAETEYQKNVSKYAAAANVKNRADYIAREIEVATKYANAKWKTDRRRQQYIETAKINIEAKADKFYNHKYKLGHVDLDLNPISYGEKVIFDIPVEERVLRKAFKSYIKGNKYWERAHGWAVKYEANTMYMNSAFRPYIYLILDDNARQEYKDEENNLNQAIADFYTDATYFGD